jgi:hypothetical protein
VAEPIDEQLARHDTAHQRVERGAAPTQHANRCGRSPAEERWLDLIADIIVDEVLSEAKSDADSLRSIREVQ